MASLSFLILGLVFSTCICAATKGFWYEPENAVIGFVSVIAAVLSFFVAGFILVS